MADMMLGEPAMAPAAAARTTAEPATRRDSGGDTSREPVAAAAARAEAEPASRRDSGGGYSRGSFSSAGSPPGPEGFFRAAAAVATVARALDRARLAISRLVGVVPMLEISDDAERASYEYWWMARTANRIRVMASAGFVTFSAIAGFYYHASAGSPAAQLLPQLVAAAVAILAAAVIGQWQLSAMRSRGRGGAAAVTVLTYPTLAAAYLALCLLILWATVSVNPASVGGSDFGAKAGIFAVGWCIWGGMTFKTVWALFSVPVVYAVTRAWGTTRDAFFPQHGLSVLQLALMAYLAVQAMGLMEQYWRQHVQAILDDEEEEAQLDGILALLLPPSVIPLVKDEGQLDARFAESFESASILFMEIQDFEDLSRNLAPERLVALLNSVFSMFDDLVKAFPGAFKVETVGPVYMVSSGCPEPCEDHCEVLATLALHCAESVGAYEALGKPLSLKLGLHSGYVIGGVIGEKLPRYRLFGDTVNTSARMETNGVPGRLHCSEPAAKRLAGVAQLRTIQRPIMQIKGKGAMQTYFVEWADDLINAGAHSALEHLAAAELAAAIEPAGVPVAAGASSVHFVPVTPTTATTATLSLELRPSPSAGAAFNPETPLSAPTADAAPAASPANDWRFVEPGAGPALPSISHASGKALGGLTLVRSRSLTYDKPDSSRQPDPTERMARSIFGLVMPPPLSTDAAVTTAADAPGQSARQLDSGTLPLLRLHRPAPPRSAAASPIGTPLRQGGSISDGKSLLPSPEAHRSPKRSSLAGDGRRGARRAGPTGTARPAAPWSPVGPSNPRDVGGSVQELLMAAMPHALGIHNAGTNARSAFFVARSVEDLMSPSPSHAGAGGRGRAGLHMRSSLEERRSPRTAATSRSSLTLLFGRDARRSLSPTAATATGRAGIESGQDPSASGTSHVGDLSWHPVGIHTGHRSDVSWPDSATASHAVAVGASSIHEREGSCMTDSSTPGIGAPVLPALTVMGGVAVSLRDFVSRGPRAAAPAAAAGAQGRRASVRSGLHVPSRASVDIAGFGAPGTGPALRISTHRASIRSVVPLPDPSASHSSSTPKRLDADAGLFPFRGLLPQTPGPHRRAAATPRVGAIESNAGTFVPPKTPSMATLMTRRRSAAAFDRASLDGGGGSEGRPSLHLARLSSQAAQARTPRARADRKPSSILEELQTPSAAETAATPNAGGLDSRRPSGRIFFGSRGGAPDTPGANTASARHGVLSESSRSLSRGAGMRANSVDRADDGDAADSAERWLRSTMFSRAVHAAHQVVLTNTVGAIAVAVWTGCAAPARALAHWPEGVGMLAGLVLLVAANAWATRAIVRRRSPDGSLPPWIASVFVYSLWAPQLGMLIALQWWTLLTAALTSAGLFNLHALVYYSVLFLTLQDLGHTLALFFISLAHHYVLLYASRAAGGPGDVAATPADSGSEVDIGFHVIEISMFMIVCVSSSLILHHYRRADAVLEGDAAAKREISWSIVQSMLPAPIIRAMRIERNLTGQASLAYSFPSVFVLQSDIVGFTKLCSGIHPSDVCQMLHDLFSAFDAMTELLDIHKIETIGDAYLAGKGCVPGDSSSLADNALAMARMAVLMQRECERFTAPDGSTLQMRVGLHLGPCVAGVVGNEMLRFHLFGDLISSVTLLEQSCAVGSILVSQAFRDALGPEYGAFFSFVEAAPLRLAASVPHRPQLDASAAAAVAPELEPQYAAEAGDLEGPAARAPPPRGWIDQAPAMLDQPGAAAALLDSRDDRGGNASADVCVTSADTWMLRPVAAMVEAAADREAAANPDASDAGVPTSTFLIAWTATDELLMEPVPKRPSSSPPMGSAGSLAGPQLTAHAAAASSHLRFSSSTHDMRASAGSREEAAHSEDLCSVLANPAGSGSNSAAVSGAFVLPGVQGVRVQLDADGSNSEAGSGLLLAPSGGSGVHSRPGGARVRAPTEVEGLAGHGSAGGASMSRHSRLLQDLKLPEHGSFNMGARGAATSPGST